MVIIFCRTTILLMSSFYVMIFQGSVHPQTVTNKLPLSSEQLTSAILLLSDYVKIPSETGNENNAAYFLIDYCREKQFHIRIMNEDKGCINFAASLYPLEAGKPNIVFLNHLDVVPSGEHTKWSYPPYSGTIKDNKVWGRGAFDNKGLAITQLTAIEQFIQISKNVSLPYNVTLLCVSGEEIGGSTGSALVAKNFKQDFNPSVVIGEGGSGMNNIAFLKDNETYFAISITEKSFIWLELKCHFMAPGHSSIAGKESANTHMIKALARLSNKKPRINTTPEVRLMFSSFGDKIGGLKGYLVQHINWTLFNPFLRYFSMKNPELESILCNTITISSIGNENPNPNRTIQEAVAVLDCRMLPGTTPDEIIAFIERTIDDPLIEIHEIRRGAPQYTTYPEKYYVHRAQSLETVYQGAKVILLGRYNIYSSFAMHYPAQQ